MGERSIYDAEQSSGDCRDFSSLPMKRKWEEFESLPGDGTSSLMSNQEKPSSAPSTSRNLMKQGFESYQEENGEPGLVTIHKKPKLDQTIIDLTQASFSNNPSINTTTEKPKSEENSLKKRAPIIYYGSRTHKQLEQVIKEFERSPYCGRARMTVLSSRDYSCIREYDSRQWASKLDMCRACIKKKESTDRSGDVCKYYESRAALAHGALPNAFSLQQLVEAGRRAGACPYYAARLMAAASEIVFCPYNYLIDPAIRANMNISLRDNILIIDEAHNIEGVCRDAATFTIRQEQIAAAMKELETASFYKFSNQGADTYINALKKSLYKWDYWFQNQKPLLGTPQASRNNGEILCPWSSARAFVDTLDNHDIGQTHYPEFSHNVQLLCRQMNDDPRAFVGVTSATCTLLETLDTILGYLFKNDGMNMDDFVMALGIAEAKYNKRAAAALPYLSVLCMNPGVVFAALGAARAVLLASATLAPVDALAAELGARFPHRASPPHVVPRERVWIGVVSSGPAGTQLRLTYAQTREPSVQDALGRTLERACRVTPHGVLCFLPSYWLLSALQARWRETGLWESLENLKHVFTENKSVAEHNDIMEDYYEKVGTPKGALLMAVYRGKVAEGMDFRDHQARLVVAVGIPYPSRTELAVEQKMQYNNRRRLRAGPDAGLLSGDDWYTAQAFRALNQALGRCIRHVHDWGAALLLDERYGREGNARRLPGWLHSQLANKIPYTYDQLERDPSGLQSFMQRMSLQDYDEDFNSIM